MTRDRPKLPLWLDLKSSDPGRPQGRAVTSNTAGGIGSALTGCPAALRSHGPPERAVPCQAVRPPYIRLERPHGRGEDRHLVRLQREPAGLPPVPAVHLSNGQPVAAALGVELEDPAAQERRRQGRLPANCERRYRGLNSALGSLHAGVRSGVAVSKCCPSCGVAVGEELQCPLCGRSLVRVNLRRVLLWALVVAELFLLAVSIRYGWKPL